MQRKGYTIGEHKLIVDFIKERNGYHEIKGRRLWVDLESSAVTSRTWQSLKETFLKRILPDIHNPYYKLTQEEISSFRVGYSMIRNKNNNLQTEKSRRSPDKKNIEKAKNGITETVLVNDANNSDSADTLIIPPAPFYADAREIKKALLSSNEESDAETAKPSKTIRDRITYTEPLSPICNIILKDFEVDDTDEENLKKQQNKDNNQPGTSKSVSNVDNKTAKLNGGAASEVTASKKRLSLKRAPKESQDTSCETSSSELLEVIKQRKDKEPRTPRKKQKPLLSNEKINSDTNPKEKNKPKEQSTDPHNHSPDSVEIPNNQEALCNSDILDSQKKNTAKKRKSCSESTVNDDVEVKVVKRNTRSSNKTGSDKLEKKDQAKAAVTAVKKMVTRHGAAGSTSKDQTSTPLPDRITYDNNSDSMESSEDSEPPNKKSYNVEAYNSKDKSENKEHFNAKPSTSKAQNSDSSSSSSAKASTPENITPNKKSKKDKASTSKVQASDSSDISRVNASTTRNKTSIKESKNDKTSASKAQNSDSSSSSNVKASTPENKTLSKKSKKDEASTSKEQVSDSSDISSVKAPTSKNKTLNKKSKNDEASTSKVQDSDSSDISSVKTPAAKNKTTIKESNNNEPSTSKVRSAGNMVLEDNNNKNMKKIAHIEAKVITIQHRENISSNDNSPVRTVRAENLLLSKSNKDDQVLLLQSNSESESSETDVFQSKSKKKTHVSSTRSFSKIIGICSEKNRIMSHRQEKYSDSSSISHISREHKSSSSWEAESESDFQQSPEMASKYAHYQKPRFGRIIPKKNDGTLLLAFKNRAYPVINDGHSSRTHLKYKLEAASKEYANYWKQKYIKEKKRTRTLAEIMRNNEAKFKIKHKQIPRHEEEDTDIAHDKPIGDKAGDTKLTEPNKVAEPKKDEEALKFTFAKDNQVTTIEGNWKVMQPIFQDFLRSMQVTNQPLTKPVEVPEIPENVVPQIVVTEPTPTKQLTTNEPEEEPERNIHEIEEDIFNEIAVLDKTMTERPEVEDASTNVTKRKGRPRGSRTKSAVKEEVNNAGDEEGVSDEKKLQNIENKAPQPSTFQSPRRTRRSLAPQEEPVAGTSGVDTNNPKQVNNDNSNNVKRETRSNRRNKRFCMKSELEHCPKTHNSSSDATESMRGCPNSECNPDLSQKNKLTLSNRNARSSLRQNNTNFSDNASISSIEGVGPKQLPNYIDTVDSKIYRTDSFEILMHDDRKHRSKLNKIDEVDTLSGSDYYENRNNKLNLSPASQNMETVTAIIDHDADNDNVSKTSRLGSSNVSLSESPEISIIENITVNKDILNNNNNNMYLNTNAEQFSNTSSADELQEISTILKDPLELKDNNKMSVDRTIDTPSRQIRSRNLITPNTQFSANSIKIAFKEPNVSDMLNERLSNMLLDSAKKVNSVPLQQLPSNFTKRKSRKRCSTPQQSRKRLNLDVVDERMEHCSRVKSRHSCPPSIIHDIIDDSRNINKTEPDNAQTKIIKPKEKKRRDIIKVKILRPKDKKNKNNEPKSSDDSESESDIFLYGFNDNVDLIHNHSETCLQTNECMQDASVAIIEDNVSVVSLDSSLLRPAECTVAGCHEQINYNMDCFLDDAQDGTSIFFGPSPESAQSIGNSSRPSAKSPSSLITEDLTDDSQREPSNWFLFSDEETTLASVTLPDHTSSDSDYMSKLFPVTCAIPDLSTITEVSRDVASNNSNTQ